MAATIETVRKLLKKPTADVCVQMDFAATVITKLKTECDGFSGAHTEEEFDLMHAYLSAHLYSSESGRVVEDQAGPIRRKYDVHGGMGLRSTSYGQSLQLLDTTGCLTSLDRRRVKARVQWVGTDLDAT